MSPQSISQYPTVAQGEGWMQALLLPAITLLSFPQARAPLLQSSCGQSMLGNRPHKSSIFNFRGQIQRKLIWINWKMNELSHMLRGTWRKAGKKNFIKWLGCLILKKEMKCKICNLCRILCNLLNSKGSDRSVSNPTPGNRQNYKSKILQQNLNAESKSCCQHLIN